MLLIKEPVKNISIKFLVSACLFLFLQSLQKKKGRRNGEIHHSNAQHLISGLREYNQPMPKTHHRCQFGSLVAKHQGEHHVLSDSMQEVEQQHKLLYNRSPQFLTGEGNVNRL